jgi:pimeloyl-ACP methyl ester carboxylesterase
MSATRMADLVAEAVAALGYDRAVVSGGDIGAIVGEALGVRHPERLVALHLTDIPFVHLANLGDAELSPAERELLEHGAAWAAEPRTRALRAR